jgi:O-acetyl-ADP-ribose deacetylase (regulator of RNase III)
MRVSIFIGDLADADAEAVCSSTNPRLSLVMGTGASIKGRGGLEILRACEAIVAAEGRPLAAGSAVVTTAGSLPHEIAIHCVASNGAHQTSEAIIRACTERALQCAAEHQCSSIAMPVFGTGHAHASFDRAIAVMAQAIASTPDPLRQVTIVVANEEHARIARSILKPFGDVPIMHSQIEPEEPVSWWSLSNE